MATFRARYSSSRGHESADNFRPYNPVKLVYSTRIPEHQWNEVLPLLDCLHKERKTRAEMLKILGQCYDFHPSMYQLNDRMAKWGYKVRKGSNVFEDTENHPGSVNWAIQHATESEFTDTVIECGSPTLDIDMAMQTPTIQVPAIDPSEIVKRGISFIFQSIIVSGAAERICAMFEIVHVLFRADWCSRHLVVLIKHLSDSIEGKDLLLLREARLLLCRQYLQWLAASKDPHTINWVLQRVEETIVGSHSDSHIRLVSCAELCHALRGMLIGPQFSEEVFHSEEFVQNLFALQVYLDSHDIEDPKLSSYANSLDAGAGVSRFFLSLTIDEQLARVLLVWSIRQIDSFEPISIINTVEEDACDDQVLLAFYSGLTKFLITKWIDYTQAVTCISSWSDSDESSSWSDLYRFTSIAETLALLTFLTIEKTRHFILVAPRDTKDGNSIKSSSAGVSRKLSSVFKTGLRELETMSERNLSGMIHPSSGFIYGNYMEDNVNTSTSLLLGHVVSTAMESLRLRQARFSRRHQSAWIQLPDQLSAVRSSDYSYGPDTMFSRVPSDSSTRSFRRGGIKLRDQLRPPSAQSFSSRYSCGSCGSGMYLVPEVEPELQRWI